MDGDAAGGPDGGHGVTGKHDSSKRSSPFLTRCGLPLPSAPLPPKGPDGTITSDAMLSRPSHREHGRPQEPWRQNLPHIPRTHVRAGSLPMRQKNGAQEEPHSLLLPVNPFHDSAPAPRRDEE